ncbi:hypothetical protein F4X86_00770 [Candidatus Saccharibacteria bacterium]|nr:hypothetical protein [Candidatus Saccharibacteria bacterium]
MKVLLSVLATLLAVVALVAGVWLIHSSNKNRLYAAYDDFCAENDFDFTPDSDDSDDLEFGSQDWRDSYAEAIAEHEDFLVVMRDVTPPADLESFHSALAESLEEATRELPVSRFDEFLSLLEDLQQSPGLDGLSGLRASMEGIYAAFEGAFHKQYAALVLAEAIPQDVIDKVPSCEGEKGFDWQKEKEELLEGLLEMQDAKREFDSLIEQAL